ncbi:MAG TPA: lysophospholipid acyltransferase family protein [Nitrospiria bacterium]|jgi:1-acyl-sn-glycerol-3-phosphate acyltransferase
MLYGIAHVLISFLAKIFFHLRVNGLDHVPLEGPLIIAANHASHLDIPLLGCTLPRRAYFVGKNELFRIPILGRFLRYLGGIPIRRRGIDRGAVVEIKKQLEEGHLLVFYLEGSRTANGMLQKAKAGVGMIAAMTGVQVVPAYIEGTYHVLPKGRKFFHLAPVTITYGAPVDLSHWRKPKGTKLDYQAMADHIMKEIASLSGDQRKAEKAVLGTVGDL